MMETNDDVLVQNNGALIRIRYQMLLWQLQVARQNRVAAPIRQVRRIREVYHRFTMNEFVDRWQSHPSFERWIRMSTHSFYRLVDLLRDLLTSDDNDNNNNNNRGRPIPHEISVFMTLQYLTGASNTGNAVPLGLSKTSFYTCLHKTLRAIGDCAALGIKFPATEAECIRLARGFNAKSDNGVIANCVGAIDGYLLATNVPSRNDCGGNGRSYFSGHYKRIGMNVQAVCDSNCMFTYFAVCSPGSTNDRIAMREKINGESLHDLIEKLPNPYVVIADAAYEATEHCVPLFYGVQRHNPDQDNFNYYGSQVRTIIERSFGIMLAKFSILKRPLANTLEVIGLIMVAIARLHNFCIREKRYNIEEIVLEAPPVRVPPTVPNLRNREGQDMGPAFPQDPVNDQGLYRGFQYSGIRDAMVERCANLQMVRP